MIKEEEGKLIVVSGAVPGTPSDETPPTDTEQVSLQQGRPSIVQAGIPIVASNLVSGAVSFTIQIQIQCSPSDVEELGPKLRRLLKEMSDQLEPEDSGDERIGANFIQQSESQDSEDARAEIEADGTASNEPESSLFTAGDSEV